MDKHQAMQMAIKYAREQQFGPAEKILRDIIASDEKFHPAFHMLGQLAVQGGRDDIATQLFHRASTLGKNIAQYHLDFAETLYYLEKPQEALLAINRAIQLNANDPKAHFVAGNALMSIAERDQAKKAFQKTISLDPNHDFAHNNLGSLYEADNQLKEAKEAYKTAIQVNEGNVVALNNLATLCIAEGDIKKAIELLNKAISIHPNYIFAHNSLSALKKYKKGDPHIRILKSLLKDIDKMPIEDRIKLHFNLGKVHADLKEYDRAFYHYHSSNKLNRSTYEYDEGAIQKTAKDIKFIYSKISLKKSKASQNNLPVPIFVVGMPRSGSTLIEQILSSHSKVHSGGELPILGELVNKLIGDFPNDVKKISDNDIKLIGVEYIKSIQKLNPDAHLIVDKMPGNFQYAGLISKILPQAFIINTHRNPMDCCVSNFTQLFQHTIPYTNDLGELGRYFNIYSAMMDHWRSVLPDGVLYDISYEDVVNNLEEEARKLIDFVGIEWEEKCLSFHKNATIVKTASAAQVRKPIYKTSVEKWRVYKKHLGPLIDALADTKKS